MADVMTKSTSKKIIKFQVSLWRVTLSNAIDAVNPEVSIATTSGSGLATGRMCFEGT
jgi:hypothetical protein